MHDRTMSTQARWFEPLVVFLPALLAVLFAAPLADDDPLRGQLVVWVAYIVMLSLVYAFLRAQGTGWRHIGLTFGVPTMRRMLVVLAQGVAVFVLAALAFALGAIVMGMIFGAPQPANFQGYDYLKGNLPLLLLVLAGVYVVSSFGEEALFRGYLMTRCMEWLGDDRKGRWLAVAVSTLAFALIHYKWGLAGMVQTGFMGAVLAVAYLRTGRNLWVNVVAHMILDTLLMVQLYLA
jgi:membrane protease YdiL (CAAX protease family)